MENIVKLVVFVPTTHANQVRKAMGDAGAGKIGNYSHCSFSVTGIARYTPLNGANPVIGTVGEFEEVEEERIEAVCSKDLLQGVMAAVKQVHPYEHVPFDIYPISLA